MRAARRTRWFVSLLACAALLWGCGDDGTIPAAEAERIRAQLTEALQNSDPYVRAEAVRAMGIIGSPALSDLLTQASHDKDPMVKAGAVIYLAQVQPDDSQSLLTDVVTTASPEVSRAVLRSALLHMPLGDARSEVLEIALRSEDAETRDIAMRVGLAGDIAQNKDPQRLNRTIIPHLSRLVGHEDPLIAGLALRAMEKLGRSDRAEPLFTDAAEATGARQLRALHVLAEAALPKYAKRLKALSVSGDAATGALAVARVASGDEATLDGVRDALAGATPEATRRALRALSHCESEDAYRMIRTYREDSDPTVRATAFRQMAAHPAVEGRDFKRGMRDDSSAVVLATLQGTAAAAPRYLGSFIQNALGSKSKRLTTLTALLSVFERMRAEGDVSGQEALMEELRAESTEEKLVAMLTDEEPPLRAAAAELIFIASPNPLARYEAMSEPRPEVTWALLNALAQHPPRDAPLRHLELFKQHRERGNVAQALVCSAGVWRGYVAASQEPPPSPEPPAEEG